MRGSWVKHDIQVMSNYCELHLGQEKKKTAEGSTSIRNYAACVRAESNGGVRYFVYILRSL